MTAEIIAFPTDRPPRPFNPDSAVRSYLAHGKCEAVASTRIPQELKRFLMAEAFESGARFSEHIARILCAHAGSQRLHCLMVARSHEGEKEKAA